MKTQQKHDLVPNSLQSETRSIRQLPVDSLRANPHSGALYDQREDKGLIASIEQHGVIVPIISSQERMLIDGSRRLGSAIKCGLDSIPAVIVDVPESKILELILECNQYRQKTTIERLREFRAHLKIEAERAAARMRHSPGANLPQEKGKARDLAAKRVGLSGRSAQNGLQILEEIERRKGGAPAIGVEAVEAALEKSILKGVKTAKRYGWIDCANLTLKAANEAPTKLVQDSQIDWFGPSNWSVLVDAMNTEDEQSRLERAFLKVRKILDKDLNHPDLESRRTLVLSFAITLSRCCKSKFGMQTK